MHCDHEHDDRCAPDCSDQLPTFAVVGRGLQGDGFKVELHEGDNCHETYLEGITVDSATGEMHSEWVSENINGGVLSYQYNLRPYTNPRTFTITFIYRRPGREGHCEWSWTTPAIPYIWTVDNDGNEEEKPDHIVGSGVATLFIRTMHTDWNERLHYPEGTTRDDFNAPEPEEAWSSTITFGLGGDVEVPDLDDIAKVIGISKEQLITLIKSKPTTIHDFNCTNLLEYIDQCDQRDLDHIHADLGFCDSDHDDEGAFGGEDTVKEYIDKQVKAVVSNLINSLGDLIYGVTFNPDGTIKTRPAGKYVPVGNINILSSTAANSIMTHSDTTPTTGDLKGE